MKTFSLVSSLFVLCASTAVAKMLARHGPKMDSEAILLTSFIKPQQEPNALLLVLNQELQNDRLLQNSMTPTDDNICEAILNYTYTTDYERSMDPCTCQRHNESIGMETGTFIVDCKYDYCKECINSTELCGYHSVSSNYSYIENLDFLPVESNTCLQYTTERDDNICVKIDFNENIVDTKCQIQIGDQFCTSCGYVSCGNSSSLESTTVDIDWYFDCSNIDGSYKINFCDYTPYTDIAIPETNAIDPFRFLYFDSSDWGTCFNTYDNTSATGRPVDSVVNAPAFTPTVTSNFPPVTTIPTIRDTTAAPIVIDTMSSNTTSASSSLSLMPLFDTVIGHVLIITVMLSFLID
jgi:hypothetical protein